MPPLGGGGGCEVPWAHKSKQTLGVQCIGVSMFREE